MGNKLLNGTFDFQGERMRIVLRRAYRTFRQYMDVGEARMSVLDLLAPRVPVQANGRPN